MPMILHIYMCVYMVPLRNSLQSGRSLLLWLHGYNLRWAATKGDLGKARQAIDACRDRRVLELRQPPIGNGYVS
jgi:hypothetical protein